MKNFVISEILYWVIAIISLYKTVTLWGIEPQRAYLFLGFCTLSVFMALFRRHYRKKFTKRKQDN